MSKFYLGFDNRGQGGLGQKDPGGGAINEFDAVADVGSNSSTDSTTTQTDYSNGMTYNSDTNQWILAVNGEAFYIYNSLADVEANNVADSVAMNAGLNYNNGFTYNSDTGTYFAAYSSGGVGEIREFRTLEDMAGFTGSIREVEMNGPDWDNGIEYDSVNNLWYGAFSAGTTVPGEVQAFSSLEDLATASNPVSRTQYSSNVTDYEMGLAIVPCFTSGTLIETPSGPVAVENLSKGDLVLTCDNGPQPVRWTGSRTLTAQELEASPNLRPVRIRASALGKNLPERDLTVSPQHRVLVRSKIAQRMFSAEEVLVAAKHLLEIDGIEIAEEVTQVEYFHILFDRHEVVFSNGAETESLYTGPQALKSLGQAARDEIFTLFPELREEDSVDGSLAARALVSGRMGRQLAQRHNKNRHELVKPI